MKRVYHILFTILLFINHSIGFSQKASRHFIDSLLSVNDTTFKLTERITYVINGIPYDTADLDNILSKFETKYLLNALYWNGKKQGEYPFYGDVAIVKFAYYQKTKRKRKIWKVAESLFDASENIPVLTIDKSVVDSLNSIKIFKSLRLKDIMYIDTVKLADHYNIRVWKVN